MAIRLTITFIALACSVIALPAGAAFDSYFYDSFTLVHDARWMNFSGSYGMSAIGETEPSNGMDSGTLELSFAAGYHLQFNCNAAARDAYVTLTFYQGELQCNKSWEDNLVGTRVIFHGDGNFVNNKGEWPLVKIDVQPSAIANVLAYSINVCEYNGLNCTWLASGTSLTEGFQKTFAFQSGYPLGAVDNVLFTT